jgi:hypothetical protein
MPPLIARPSTGAHASTVQRPSTPRDGRTSGVPFRLADVGDVLRVQKQPRQTAPQPGPDLGDDNALLTVHDTARFLEVSVTWVYEHVRPDIDDRLPHVKLGKYLRLDRRDLQAYVDATRAESRRLPRRR